MSTTTNGLLIRTADAITPDWLGRVLGRPDVAIEEAAPIGTGQMSGTHRVRWRDGNATGSVVVKLASEDAASRATGVGMGAYGREIAFYGKLAARLGAPIPGCHLAVQDPAEGWFTLVLEDVDGASQGDQIAGCTPDEAERALLALARVHAPILNDLHLGSENWLNLPNPLNQQLLTALLPGFLERYGDRIAPEHAEVCRRLVPALDAWDAARRPPLGLVHGDFRLDNLLYDEAGAVRVVDWQTVGWGPVMHDASYFLGGALDAEDRRAHEERLIRAYHDELLRLGATGLDWEACWEGYRERCFAGLVMVMAASMVTQRTDRGDEMFVTWIARAAQQALDLDALSLLPEPGAKPAPLRPAAADEGRHEPGAELAWNESWYADVIAADGSLAVYTRIGRVPNADRALFTAAIVRADGPAIMVVDAEAPLPPLEDERQAIDRPGLRAHQEVLEPLERFRVALEATGAAHEDHAAPLRGAAGTPVPVAFDLTWTTEGVPFQWRQATRYEIPCRVAGTVTIDGVEIALEGPGQRDHSWGARDWFATDWMWSALHLDDGTRIHAVMLPARPGLAVGYVQRDGAIDELEGGTVAMEVAPDGLFGPTTVTLQPSGLELTATPRAFGAVLLLADDGRRSHFPRAQVDVRTADGRRGTGWMEWNLNQPADAD